MAEFIITFAFAKSNLFLYLLSFLNPLKDVKKMSSVSSLYLVSILLHCSKNTDKSIFAGSPETLVRLLDDTFILSSEISSPFINSIEGVIVPSIHLIPIFPFLSLKVQEISNAEVGFFFFYLVDDCFWIYFF